MKLPRRSLVVSVALSFAAAYGVSEVAHLVFSNLDSYDDQYQERNHRIWDELRLDAVLLKDQEIEALKTRLDEEKTIGDIDFFILKEGGKVVFFGNGEGDLKSIESDAYKPNQFLRTDTGSIGTVQVGDSLLAIGVSRTWFQYMKILLSKQRTAVAIDIGFMALLVFGIAFYFFKDLLAVIGVFKKRDSGGLEKMRSKLRGSSSREAAIMAEGLSAYQRQVNQSKSNVENLRRNLRSSVRTELDSGRTPPYQFDAVMVRTDINNYSILYSTQEVEPFMAVIDELFTKASSVVDRYGGYVTDFVGDEIVYYFKESEHENAAAVALSAIRDIHQISDELDLKTQKEFGYAFRVKSAAASGSLRFGPQAGGFALSGAIFVETVRILSQIDEKVQNSVYFPSRLEPRLNEVCRSLLKKTVHLRGIAGETHLHAVTDFTQAGKASTAQFFRADSDLCQAIGQLGAVKNPELARDYLRAIGRLGSPSQDPKVYQRYTEVLASLLSDPSITPGSGDEDPKRVATVISLSAKIVSPVVYDQRLRRQLDLALKHRDSRVVANAVDALIFFEPSGKVAALDGLKSHADNRVTANVLMKRGMEELSDEVVEGLKKMVRSPDRVFKASGIFAAGELARHYRASDLAFYETQFAFHSVFDEIAEFLTSTARTGDPYDRVRNQAAQALMKAKYSKRTNARRAA